MSQIRERFPGAAPPRGAGGPLGAVQPPLVPPLPVGEGRGEGLASPKPRQPIVARRAEAAGTRRRRWPTSGGAALRSALVPGWGQAAAGHPRRGLLLLLAALAIASVPISIGVALLRPFAPLLHQPLL